MFSLKEDFVIVLIDKAANNVAFINIHTFINNKTKDHVIKKNKFYLSKHKTNLANNMQDLPVMYWIPKIHKNPISFCFIVASPVCRIKPL